MFCNKCGNEVKDNQIFCNKCGNRLKNINNNLNSFNYLNNNQVNNKNNVDYSNQSNNVNSVNTQNTNNTDKKQINNAKMNNSINNPLIVNTKKANSGKNSVIPVTITSIIVFAIIGALLFFIFKDSNKEDYYFTGTNDGNANTNNYYGNYGNFGNYGNNNYGNSNNNNYGNSGSGNTSNYGSNTTNNNYGNSNNNNYGNTGNTGSSNSGSGNSSNNNYGNGSNKTPTKKNGKYVTDIENDHEYYGLTINGKNDAIKLIQDDSVKQKNNNYPQEIINIENNIINKYGITAVNLKELDVDFAREIENVISKIYNEYPQARGYITNLALGNFDSTVGEGAIAFFMPIFPFGYSATASQFPVVIKTQIQLNADYYLAPSKLEGTVKLSSKMGHFPANANKTTPVAHEFGHYLSFIALLKHYNISSVLTVDEGQYQKLTTLIMDFQNGTFSKSMEEEAYQNYLKDGNTKVDFDSWRAQISQYAVAKNEAGQYNYDETIAEAFHDVYINGDNANITSKYIIKVLKKNIGG